MEAAAPSQPSSEYAEEGSVAHALAEKCLRGHSDASVFEDITASVVYAPEVLEHDDFAISAEMCESVQLYLDVVRENHIVQADHIDEGDVILEVEKKFKITEDVWGTNDACTYWDMGRLTIYDLKYGKGVQVEVEDNTQLMIYLLGALREAPEVLEFEIVIVQPRGFHPDGPVRRARLTPKEVMDFAARLSFKVGLTKEEDAPLIPGHHCKWCDAADTCSARTGLALKTFSPVVKDGENSVQTMPAKEVGKILAMRKDLEAWLDSLHQRAKEILRSGQEVPGMKLVRSTGNRQWVEAADVEWLAEANDIDPGEVYKPLTLVSPAQFEKSLTGLKPKERKELLAKYTEQKSTIALVPESDKRNAIPNATDVFDEIK